MQLAVPLRLRSIFRCTNWLAIGVVFTTLFIAHAVAQPIRQETAQVPADPSAPNSAAQTARQKKPAAPKPKPTPQQEQGLRLLKSAQAEAAALEPDMRSFLLWQISNAYSTLDPAKKMALLRDAFGATQLIEVNSPGRDCPNSEADPCGVKGWLQESILSKILQQSPSEAEQLVARAEPKTRTQIAAQLVQHYITQKNFDRARSLLTSIAEEDEYPYHAATEFILALPENRNPDRTAIFSQALSNFGQHGTHGSIGGEDIGTLIVRTWDHVPSGLVLEAIDQVLSEAKSDTALPLQMSMTSSQGSISLDSTYRYRLFQLLPVLEDLDKSRADALLNDDTQMQEDLQKFPKGMQSLNPTIYGKSDTAKTDGATQTMMSVGTGGSEQATKMQALQNLQAEFQRRQDTVTEEAEADPKQAIADALTLPITGISEWAPSPRANVLEAIARATQKKDAGSARSALDEVVKLEDQLALNQARMLESVPQLYLDIGDEEGAKRALKGMLKIADKLYVRDKDPDDPNQAFKGVWPSTHLRRECIQIAGKISPNLAQEFIAEVPDLEIKTFQQVAYANSLAGATDLPDTIAEHRKTGVSMQTSDDDH